LSGGVQPYLGVLQHVPLEEEIQNNPFKITSYMLPTVRKEVSLKIVITCIGSEEVDQAISGPSQSEAFYQEYSQHQVGEGSCHIYCLEEMSNGQPTSITSMIFV
jgi:hypothetical protein